MTKSSQPKTWRDVLPVHPAAELFPRMSESELRELGEDIRANKLQFPIATWFDPVAKVELLIDGRNRLDAMELIGLLTAEVISYRSRLTCIDPWAFVVSANIKRRHLTAEQKRELIAKLIKQTPNKSDRQIAKQTKTSPTTVGKIRKESEAAGDVSKLDTRTDIRGRKQPAAKPKKLAKPAAPAKIIELDRSDYSEVPATSATGLSWTEHALINDISRLLKEADPKLSGDRTEVFTRIRALVDTGDIVDEALRLVEKMTVGQRQDFIARLQKGGLVVACGSQDSAEIPIEQRKAEHPALAEIPADLSIPVSLLRRPA
jgi:hypothetical protein